MEKNSDGKGSFPFGRGGKKRTPNSNSSAQEAEKKRRALKMNRGEIRGCSGTWRRARQGVKALTHTGAEKHDRKKKKGLRSTGGGQGVNVPAPNRKAAMQ